MATMNEQGHVLARCPVCEGALTAFLIGEPQRGEFGTIFRPVTRTLTEVYRLAKCSGCGAGSLITFVTDPQSNKPPKLIDFYPEARERLTIPKAVPVGIVQEFREGERCSEAGCNRAAAAMFRSVLDKTLRANGYKEKRGTNLEQQIDAAAKDGVITASRQKRAHDEIRVLGNDVLHAEWEEVENADVEAARQYAQRILEDFYDDRESVINLLREKGRKADDDPKK